MIKLGKKVLSFLLALSFIILALGVPVSVEAAKMSYPTSYELIYGGIYSGMGPEIVNFPSGGKIKNIKNSNKSVVKVEKYPDILSYTPLKAGKSTVQFDVVYGGKKKHFKVKITVRNFVNPLEYIKLNGEDYLDKLNEQGWGTFTPGNVNQKKYKVFVKPKSEWAVKEIYYWNGNNSKNIKNNGSFTYKSSDESAALVVKFYNTSIPTYVVECHLDAIK